MIKKRVKSVSLISSVAFMFTQASLQITHAGDQEKPNVVYILADDLGFGDLSCYGQKKFKTPHIDRLAELGMKFTNHYSGSTVSAPSRSSLMTGEHTGHTPIRGNKKLPLPAQSVTVAELFKAAGYTTGQFGKWGLGEPGTVGEPNNQGFDTFYGFTDQSKAHRYYPDHVIDNGKEVPLPGNDWTNLVTYATDAIHKKALEFIDKNHTKPFFFYYPCNIPHAELIVPKDSILKKYEGKFLPEKTFKGSDYVGQGTTPGGYCSQNQGHAVFAAMVNRLDMYVGQIVAKLEQYGIRDNTLILFTSDNGPHQEAGADPKYFNSQGGLRGIKRDLYEGGIRVPFIANWPGKITPGSVSHHISAFWDFLPTCAELINQPVPDSIDGISYLPELLGQGNQQKVDFLYWEFYEKNGRRGLRKGKWKAVQYKMKADPYIAVKLFDLEKDPAEANNIASQYKDTTAKMLSLMELAHGKSDLFSWEFESKRCRVTIFVIDANSKPVPDFKVNLRNNGTRFTWKDGQVVYTGVNKNTNPEFKVYDKNGSVIHTKRIKVTNSDVLDTVQLSTTGIMEKSSAKGDQNLFLKNIGSLQKMHFPENIEWVEIYSLYGRRILSTHPSSINSRLQITPLPVGIYTIRMKGKDNIMSEKIMLFDFAN